MIQGVDPAILDGPATELYNTPEYTNLGPKHQWFADPHRHAPHLA